jgi:hypothetical protein
MYLVDRCKLGSRQESIDRELPVCSNRFSIVAAPKADVEPRHRADRNAAATSKEPVRQPAQACCTNDLDRAQRIFRMMMSSSA